MYEVIDLIYDEEVFVGTYEECEQFVSDNGGYGMKILPV
jgi:hypothetical protein